MPTENNFLDILKGEKLSSVVFVMDYLQLDFDGNRFTMNIWPSVIVLNIEYKFGMPDYRNKICSVIGQVVSEVIFKDKEFIAINFQNGDSIKLSLDPNNPELLTPEIATFSDVENRFYVFY
jgi:hypothetical protein